MSFYKTLLLISSHVFHTQLHYLMMATLAATCNTLSL
jgi:hypothetical protein